MESKTLEGKVKGIEKMQKFVKYVLEDGTEMHEEGKEPSLKTGDEGTFEYHETVWGGRKTVKIMDGFEPEPKKGQQTLMNYTVQEIKNEDSLEIIQTTERVSGKTSEREIHKRTEGVKVFGDLLDRGKMLEKLRNARYLYEEYKKMEGKDND